MKIALFSFLGAPSVSRLSRSPVESPRSSNASLATSRAITTFINKKSSQENLTTKKKPEKFIMNSDDESNTSETESDDSYPWFNTNVHLSEFPQPFGGKEEENNVSFKKVPTRVTVGF